MLQTRWGVTGIVLTLNLVGNTKTMCFSGLCHYFNVLQERLGVTGNLNMQTWILPLLWLIDLPQTSCRITVHVVNNF